MIDKPGLHNQTLNAGNRAEHSPHAARSMPLARAWLPVLALGVVALLLRVLDLGGFVTLDEINFWFDRSERFLEAILAGNFADTAIRPHPGVTTMWLGSAGIVLRRALLEGGIVAEMPFATMLALMRLPAALVHTVAVLVGYALLRRMLPAALALLAAVLWAADPFMLAYSRVLHLDALMTSFTTLALLAACFYWHHQRHTGVLVLSAVCGALALLSKVPAVVVLPVVGLVALGSVLWSPDARVAALRRAALDLLAWGGVFTLTVVMVWPAVWADPLRVVELMQASFYEEASRPHLWGNYYLGQPVAVPGASFYPAALALRLTPITLLGLLLLPLVWRQGRDLPAARRDLLVLAGFAVLFLLLVSLSPKKFNRYLLPIFPALDVLAAAGWVWAIAWARNAWPRLPRALPAALVGSVAALAVMNAAWWHPYSLIAFNQALGGAPAGARVFLVGWGEGLDRTADWLHQQPDITGVTIASTMGNSFQPLLRDGVQSESLSDGQFSAQAGYALFYVRDVQRRDLEPPFARLYHEAVPLHVVAIHGVDYAWIYRVPPRPQHPLDAAFGPDGNIRLLGYDLDTRALRSTGTLSVTVHWHARSAPEQDYLLFTHILDDAGATVGQTDAPPGGPQAPTTEWTPERYISRTYPVFLPADLPPGEYWLSLGLYDPRDFARLPLRASVASDAPDDGEHALLLPITIPGRE